MLIYRKNAVRKNVYSIDHFQKSFYNYNKLPATDRNATAFLSSNFFI